MRRTHLLLLAGAAGITIAPACADIAAPTRDRGYEWRLCVEGGLPGDCPTFDSLSFHWPRSSLPVKLWVEDSAGLPAHFRDAVALWKNALIYGEYDAAFVTDSTAADVIVRFAPPPPAPPAPSVIRLPAMQATPCSGATDVLINSPLRTQILRPMRVYIYTGLSPSDPAVRRCLQVVAIHELGHTMGLFQHSPNLDDVMYTTPTLYGISTRDITTIQFVYHLPADLTPAP